MKLTSCPFCGVVLPNHDSRCNFNPNHGRTGNLHRRQHPLLKQTINTRVSTAPVGPKKK